MRVESLLGTLYPPTNYMSNRVEKYIKFVERDPLPKTRRWDVINVRTGYDIGEIQWYGGFRKYVFFPENETLFDHDCLKLIADFIETATKQHLYAKKGVAK